MEGGLAIANLTQLITFITEAIAFIWGLFGDFISEITANPLLVFMVVLAIVCGSIGLVIKIVKAFGLKGRRR